MPPHPDPTPLTPRAGVLTLSGYGLRLAIDRGHLVAEDGIAANRRRGRFPRAMPGFRRVVVLGHAGTVTLEALRWLHDLGIALVQLGSNGEVIVAAGPIGLDDARLRRAQALAAHSDIGVRLTRWLLKAKLEGQRAVLGRLGTSDSANSTFDAALDTLDAVEDLGLLRQLEAQAAVAYWDAWQNVRMPFAKRDDAAVPEHWRRFNTRSSPLTGQPRRAANPANALLNYCYAVLESEATIAALAIGLDPGLGILHADQRARASLACDLMEPVRPVVDGFVLEMLATRVFRRQDFFETREGVCRVLPPLSQALAETAHRWAGAVAPYAERVAQELLATRFETATHSGVRRTTGGRENSVPTRLTQSRRSAGREPYRRQLPRTTDRMITIARTCQNCGNPLGPVSKRICPACVAAAGPAIARAHAALRPFWEAGKDPAAKGRPAQAEKMRRHNRALAAWSKAGAQVTDPSVYRREILPRLKSMQVVAIAKATGLCVPYASEIRKGRIPHARHWAALRQLVTR
ncbi:MAG: CRISPR-associated endonuclease Cas1 [Candidatus Binatia bacterium]